MPGAVSLTFGSRDSGRMPREVPQHQRVHPLRHLVGGEVPAARQHGDCHPLAVGEQASNSQIVTNGRGILDVKLKYPIDLVCAAVAEGAEGLVGGHLGREVVFTWRQIRRDGSCGGCHLRRGGLRFRGSRKTIG